MNPCQFPGDGSHCFNANMVVHEIDAHYVSLLGVPSFSL